MKTIKRSEVYNSSPDKIFHYLDDLGVTGMHMTKSSAMMMGSKLHLEYLTVNHSGPGTKYRWTGTMMGMKMDFTVEVTKWIEGVVKVWETIGEAKMIIYSWYRMNLLLTKNVNETVAELSITYEKPKGWFLRILSFLFADWYCNWCLKNMLTDTKKQLESNSKVKNDTLKFKPSVVALTLAGVIIMMTGIYFIFLRPPLLPEDARYIGSTIPAITDRTPGLSLWLKKVFWVLGGYIFSSGLLVAFVANTSFKNRGKGAFNIVAIAGFTSIGFMTYVNFIINSNFKWLLLAFTVPWLIALFLYRIYK